MTLCIWAPYCRFFFKHAFQLITNITIKKKHTHSIKIQMPQIFQTISNNIHFPCIYYFCHFLFHWIELWWKKENNGHTEKEKTKLVQLIIIAHSLILIYILIVFSSYYSVFCPHLNDIRFVQNYKNIKTK